MGNGDEEKNGVKSAAINCHRYISRIGLLLCEGIVSLVVCWGTHKNILANFRKCGKL